MAWHPYGITNLKRRIMELIERIDWEKILEHWEYKLDCSSGHDEVEMRELYGKKKAALYMGYYEDDFEEYSRRIRLYKEGRLEEAIEGLSIGDLADFVCFEGKRYEWEEVLVALWSKARKEIDRGKREDILAKAELIEQDKYDEAYRILGKEFLEDYSYD